MVSLPSGFTSSKTGRVLLLVEKEPPGFVLFFAAFDRILA